MPGAAAGGNSAAPAPAQYQDTVGTSESGYADSSVQGTDVGGQAPYPMSDAERLEHQQAAEQTTQPQPTQFQHVA